MRELDPEYDISQPAFEILQRKFINLTFIFFTPQRISVPKKS